MHPMIARCGPWIAMANLGYTLAASVVQAQTNPSLINPDGLPEQIIPTFEEVGITWNSASASGGGEASDGVGGGTSAPGSTTAPGNHQSGGSGGEAVLDAMMAQSYGQTAYSTAVALGNNPSAEAAFGQLESNWRNVATANGTSSATGPWQITGPTWNEYVSRHNLPYTAADRSNPEAQAVVSNYILRDYASKISAQIGTSATVSQTYAAWVYGPGAGANIARATSDAPLSNYVSATNLANNNMTGWTVGDFNSYITRKVGSVATQTVSTTLGV